MTSVPTRARDRTYPRSVGVLGQGFLAESVLRRLLRALPEQLTSRTYGRNPDLLTQLQRLRSTSSCKRSRSRSAQ